MSRLQDAFIIDFKKTKDYKKMVKEIEIDSLQNLYNYLSDKLYIENLTDDRLMYTINEYIDKKRGELNG